MHFRRAFATKWGKKWVHIISTIIFHNIEYDDGFYGGEFSALDDRVYCMFLYDRETKEFIDIWDNTQPIDEILPIPIWWLDKNLEKNGELGKHESKVSY